MSRSDYDPTDMLSKNLSLVWGVSLSGKTSLAIWLANEAIKKYWYAFVVDPRWKNGHFPGVRVVDNGVEGVNAFLDEVLRESNYRYQRLRDEGLIDFHPWLIIFDEVYCASDSSLRLPDFLEAAKSRFQEIGIVVVLLSQSDKLPEYSNSKMFDLKLQLDSPGIGCLQGYLEGNLGGKRSVKLPFSITDAYEILDN